MARTIATIKSTMTTAFMADETIAAKYGFTVGASFDSTFSKVSLESILFYVVAVAMWTLETLFDVHKTELSTLLDTKKPHRLKWYRDKALAFQFGRSLDEDADTYSEIVDSEMVVKYASAVEYQGKLYIKVAKGGTSKEQLSSAEETALTAYFADIKDAGVVLEVVNKAADHYAAEFDIYYDPMVYSAEGLNLSTGADTIRDTIKDYIENQIPFNGEYRNASLVDTLQALDGVVIPELKLAKTISDEEYNASGAWTTISAKSLPASGYYKVYADTDLVLNFIAYQAIETV